METGCSLGEDECVCQRGRHGRQREDGGRWMAAALALCENEPINSVSPLASLCLLSLFVMSFSVDYFRHFSLWSVRKTSLDLGSHAGGQKCG
ncbi:hypothetical protein DPEC_G00251950 [Dallia pectoralis]|uniref:Uncharacterized protein n=1 Tax=Dallia pectoralis TaxID=75939 RepID=A0ACC2FTJ0_DALPE|nr:hypothetical protein DPEC_G00251950 [Dallia pectoralis]